MSGERLRVEVLGPIRVRDGAGSDVTPAGPLQRRLLALLVLRRDRVVTVDAAVDLLWPERPPRDPAGALHNQVFRLRRALGVDAVESAGDGYRLTSSRIDVDADELAGLLRDDDPRADGAEGAAAIDEVLERWRGPAYPELADVDDGRAEAVRLEELRVRAREMRAERWLAAGAVDAAVADLAALVDDEPLRERPRALLLAALARSGRHAEALRVYDDFRRRLGDELGIEPSPALAAQHAELLAGAGLGGWAPATRLPVPATALLGRDALVDEVVALTEACRSVTLVGPGGVGKTRVAVEVGRRLAAARPERPVVWCELAPAEPEAVLDVVGAALGVDRRGGVDPVDRLAQALQGTPVVLLLDNCEHVLEPAADLVARLGAACPEVAVLATSRERLRVPGETVRVVPTLGWEADGAPALELFVERARAVAPGFDLGADGATVAEIVRRLDGLPLAIELAAGLLHTHDVAEVAAGLDRRFGLLSSGYRTSPRHGSLRAAVSWSHDLLDEPLRRVFADVSVFAGPFTVADAAAVTATDPSQVAGALAELVERSLVLRSPGQRYVLLETLRAFGAEQLVAQGRDQLVGERHARHWLAEVEAVDGKVLDGADLAGVDAVLPDLRTALGWQLDHGDVEAAGRLVAALRDYGFLRQRPDVLAWANRVVAADPDDASPMAAVVRTVAATAAWMAGDPAGNVAGTRRALELAERAGAPLVPEVATACGTLDLFEGRLDGAAEWYRRAAVLASDDLARRFVATGSEVLARGYAGDPSATEVAARVLEEAGDAVTAYAAYLWYCAGEADLLGDPTSARERHARAIELAERTGAALVTGLAGASRASIDARLGDPEVAAAEYRRLIEHWRRSGVWSTQWTMLRSIAVLLERLGRRREAAVLEGAVRATAAGTRIFGADEAALAELGARLRERLGDDAYDTAIREGAALDGDAAVEHALASL